MTTYGPRAVEAFSSLPSPCAGRRAWAALSAALAALMLSIAPAAAEPTARANSSQNAPPGHLSSIGATFHFDNYGTNPRITSASYSTTEYYNETSVVGGRAFFRIKTNDQLNAMDEPPSNPFTVVASVTMTNDEGQTASTNINLVTHWHKRPPPQGPVLSRSTANAPAGLTVSAFVEYFFDNAGTGAYFTNAVFSTMDYYVEANTGVTDGFLEVRVKTSEELEAMSSPPPNPFTVEVTLTMTNNQGQTATGTVEYVTNY